MVKASPRYLTIGDCAIDHIILSTGKKIPPQFGGAPIYAAIGINIWCPSVGIVSVVSANYPQQFLDALNKVGINIAGIRRSRLPIGLEIKFLYHADGSRTGTTASPVIDFADRHFPNVFRALTTQLLPAFIHPSLSDFPQLYYQAVGVHITPMLMSRQTEFLIALDQKIKLKTLDLLTPDILPKWQRDHEGKNLPELSLADATLPSDAECEAYFGALNPEAAAKRLSDRGAKVVVVKQGKQGSLVYESNGDSFSRIPIYPATVKDVTGAGDAFGGGFLVGLDETGDPKEAALYGAVSASFVIEDFGPLHALKYTRKVAEARLAYLRALYQQ
jgi:ribokinase